jgi:hypothetical protein
MTVRIKFEDGAKLGRKLEVRTKVFSEKQTKAIQKTALRAADEIEFAGREDIRAGGNFSSPRWIDGFRAKVSYRSRTDINIRVTHSVAYWKVFEFGAKILGRPMLWIPLSFGNAFGVSAKDYPLPLFRVDRAGKAPLLVDKNNGPQYFGKESVDIPKKWHLREISKRVSRRMGEYYRETMRNG